MAEGNTALGRFAERASTAALAAAGATEQLSRARPVRSRPLDIAIPIFNNAAVLARCLESLLPTLGADDTVWLFDDASEEPAIASLLRHFINRRPGSRVVTNPRNLGFVGTANRALQMTEGDLVLLNSDTEVGNGWLEHLQDVFDRNPRAGIVCPLSDRATILSVLPAGGEEPGENTVANAAAATLGDIPLPTAVGFCMLIRRKMLEEIGTFSQAFAPGYGEENDLSMRALRAGWDILAADRACVFHHSGGSFTPESRKALQARHQARLDRIWPEYAPLVQAWWRDNPLRVKTERLAWRGRPGEAVVHVLHRQYHVGGTERVARTLIRGLGERYRQTLVYPGATDNAWCDVEQRANGHVRELMLNNRWIRPATRVGGHGADLGCAHSERALVRLVLGSGARIVHFHHMLHWDSLLLPQVARALGCRVVISVHDFWFNCPIHNQLEHSTGRACGRSHAQPDDRCAACLNGYGLEARAGEYASARSTLAGAMLADADAVIVPSQFIRDKLLSAFPLGSAENVHVQPHGVEVPATPPARDARSENSRSRVLGYFGGDQVLKGAQIVLDLARALKDFGATVRIHGRVRGFDANAMPANVELRGFYNPDDVGRVMEDIDLALVPSHYEESFSMILSECWAHGVPVLASSRGALPERVVPGINGWLVDDLRPESWVRATRTVLDGDTLDRCRERLARHAVTSIGESVEALERLYEDLLRPAPLPAAPEVGITTPARFRRKLQALRNSRASATSVAGQVLGVMRDHWGTAHYRVRFPLEDLARSGNSPCIDFHAIRDSGFDIRPALQRSGARHVVVQPFLSDEGLKLMESLHRESNLHVTLVVDDLWTELHADNPARAKMPDDVPGRLAYAASLSHSLVLTTSELKRRLGLSHDNVHVIDNALPAWIWEDRRTTARRTGDRLRIGWAGAPQHATDLAFLEPVVRATADLADWVFLGMCPGELRPLAAETHGMVPFERYPEALAGMHLDLAIAPLADTPFNRCKSHLKVIEFGILGVPVIAANLEPYRHCPVPLAEPDDTADWTGRIRDLLQDGKARRRLAKSLRQWVGDHHMTKHRRADWRAALGIDPHAQ